MAARINLFFLFFLGCAFYFISSTALRASQRRFNADLSLSETARLLGKQLSEQSIPRDQVTCAIARYFFRLNPTKNALVLSTPHVKNFKGSEETQIEVEHKTGTLEFKVYVFGEGEILTLGETGFKNFCYMGEYEDLGNGKIIFKPRE